jgi:heat shock protein HslJ
MTRNHLARHSHLFIAVLTLFLFSCSTYHPSSIKLGNSENMNWVTRTTSFIDESNNASLNLDMKNMSVSGSDGCNRFSGNILELDQAKISFGEFSSTKMNCPNIADAQEYQRRLTEARFYIIENEQLVLKDINKSELMRLYKKEQEQKSTAAIYSPRQGVICDSVNQFCVDSDGISVALSAEIFGAEAREKWQDILDSEDFDPTSYSMSSGLYCDSQARICKTVRWDEQINPFWTKTLFGTN